MHSDHSNKCHRCGRIVPKSVVAFICILCVWCQAAIADGFIKVANGDQPINGPSSQAMEHIFTSTGTNGTLALSASPGDMVTDFINVQKIEHPKPIEWPKGHRLPDPNSWD